MGEEHAGFRASAWIGCPDFKKMSLRMKIAWVWQVVALIVSLAILTAGIVAYTYDLSGAEDSAHKKDQLENYKTQVVLLGMLPGAIAFVFSICGMVSAQKHIRSFGLFSVLASIVLVFLCSFSGIYVGVISKQFVDVCLDVHDECCDLGTLCSGNWRDTYYKTYFTCEGTNACPAGKYIHQSHCYNCPQGQYKVGDATGCCSACDAGKSTANGGSKLVADCVTCGESCPAGEFGFGGGCTKCESGRFKAASGVGCCKSCDSGLSSDAGASACITEATCDEGKYAWGSKCKACPAGKFGSSTMGISFCAFCEPGKYQPLALQTACTNCPSGQYTSFYLGSPYCTACPNGKTSEAGKSDCDRRRLGQYTADYTTADTTSQHLADGSTSEALAIAVKYQQQGARGMVSQLEETFDEILAAYSEPAVVKVFDDMGSRRLTNETLPEPPSCSCCYNSDFKKFCTTYVGSIAGVCALNLMMAIVQVRWYQRLFAIPPSPFRAHRFLCSSCCCSSVAGSSPAYPSGTTTKRTKKLKLKVRLSPQWSLSRGRASSEAGLHSALKPEASWGPCTYRKQRAALYNAVRCIGSRCAGDARAGPWGWPKKISKPSPHHHHHHNRKSEICALRAALP
jgi:hypothetical protein